jgi:putative resolvase
MLHEGLTTGQAAKYISRHPKTLQAMDRAGVLPARRTASGRRYWLRRDLDRYLGRTGVERPRRTVCYCRVSSQAQRPDLKNQRRIVEEFAIAKGIANLEFIEEIGGGLNFKRPKFTALVDSIAADELAMLIVAHKDRLELARFGFELQEMVQDLMAITHGFSSRLYGLRNYRRALKEALK